MAESGRRSVRLSSDQVFDRTCSLCAKEQKTREAIDYCKMCCEFLCSGCLGVHNNLPALKGHRRGLVGRSAMLKVPERNDARNSLTAMCEEHGRLIDLFCHNHETLCCSVCQAEKHVLCKDSVVYIPNLACFPNRQDLDKAIDDLRHANKQMTDIQTSCKSEQTRILKDRNNILGQIAVARRRLNGILDIMEQDTIKEAETRIFGCDVIIRTSLQECDDISKAIQQTQKQLEAIDKRKEAQVFVLIRKGREQIKKCWEMQRTRKEGQQTKVRFTANIDLEKMLIQKKTLGEFSGTGQRSQQLNTGRIPSSEQESERMQSIWIEDVFSSTLRSCSEDDSVRTTGEGDDYTIVTGPNYSDDDSDDTSTPHRPDNSQAFDKYPAYRAYRPRYTGRFRSGNERIPLALPNSKPPPPPPATPAAAIQEPWRIRGEPDERSSGRNWSDSGKEYSGGEDSDDEAPSYRRIYGMESDRHSPEPRPVSTRNNENTNKQWVEDALNLLHQGYYMH